MKTIFLLSARWTVALCCLAALSACTVSYDQPEKTADAVVFEPESSMITIPVMASLDDLQTRLNNLVPSPLAKIDEDRNACVPAQWAEVCVLPRVFRSGCAQWLRTKVTPDIDCHLQGEATRGGITIGGSGNTLALAMPVAVQITATGRGDIGKHIEVTATGAADLHASVAVDVDEAWNPTTLLSADYSWRDRLGVTILGIRITFASKADEQIDKALADFQASLPQRMAELNLKGRAEQAWMEAFTVLQVNQEPPVWVRFTPEEVGFSGAEIVDRDARAVVLARGKAETFVGEAPEPIAPSPLPGLRKDLPPAGFTFQLPIVVDYAALRDAAGPALRFGERQDVEVDGVGTVGVTVRGVDIHQTSGGALAIGINLNADTPSDWFDTDGVVWLTGKPVIDNQTKMVRVADLRLYGGATNRTSDILIKVMQVPTVTDLIESALVYDFSADYDKGLAAANAAFSTELAPDLHLSGSVADARVDQVIAGPQALMMQIAVSGTATVRFGVQP